MSEGQQWTDEGGRRAVGGALIGLWGWAAFSEGFTPALVALGELLMAPVSGASPWAPAAEALPILWVSLLGAVSTWALHGALGLIGSVHPALGGALRRTRVRVKVGSIKLPGVGEVELSQGQADALHPLYVELRSRVANHRLVKEHDDGHKEHIGALRPAFDSLHRLFGVMREVMHAAGPSGQPLLDRTEGAKLDAAQQAIEAVDACVRPFLSRWHPHFDRWEKTGLPERRWGQWENCRNDLDLTLDAVRPLVAALDVVYGLRAADAPKPAEEAGSGLLKGFSKADPDLTTPVGWGAEIDAAYLKLWHQLRVGLLQPGLDAERVEKLAARADEVLAALPFIPPDARLREGERRPDEAILSWCTELRRLQQDDEGHDKWIARLEAALGDRPGSKDRGQWRSPPA
jgi:hypothetical protein